MWCGSVTQNAADCSDVLAGGVVVLSQRNCGEVPNSSQSREKSLWSQNRCIGNAVKRWCRYSIWNFFSSEKETLKTLYNYRSQKQFPDFALLLNAYPTEKPWQLLCPHILWQCRPSICFTHLLFVFHYFTISPDQFFNFLNLKHQHLQMRGTCFPGEGACLYVASSGKHSSISPWGSILLLINYLCRALGRKVLSSRAPNK